MKLKVVFKMIILRSSELAVKNLFRGGVFDGFSSAGWLNAKLRSCEVRRVAGTGAWEIAWEPHANFSLDLDALYN